MRVRCAQQMAAGMGLCSTNVPTVLTFALRIRVFNGPLHDIRVRRAQLGSPWMPSRDGPYANVVNVVVSNTGATTVPSGWLLALTPQAGAPYVHVDQSWEEKPSIFRGSLAMFGNLVHLPMHSAFPLFWLFWGGFFFGRGGGGSPLFFYFFIPFGWWFAPRQAYQALFPGSMVTVGGVVKSLASRSADWVPQSVQLNGVLCQLTASTA